jgi:hypothetical protein
MIVARLVELQVDRFGARRLRSSSPKRLYADFALNKQG